MALWALTTNPRGQPWSERFTEDHRKLASVLQLVNKYKHGGTRNRFQPARLFAALTLGQMVVQVGATGVQQRACVSCRTVCGLLMAGCVILD